MRLNLAHKPCAKDGPLLIPQEGISLDETQITYRYPSPLGVPGQQTNLISTMHMIFPSTSSPSRSVQATPHLTDPLFRTKPSASTTINSVIGLPSAANIRKPHLPTPRTSSPKTHSTQPLRPSRNKPASKPVHYTPKAEMIMGPIG